MNLPHITPTLASSVLLLASLYTPGANAANVRYAVVTQGAFLLSETAVKRDDERFVHSLVGYLPIGTTVAIDDGEKQIYATERDLHEDYVLVRSELGLSGWLREDLFVELPNRPIVVPIGSQKIKFYRDVYANDEKPAVCKGEKCIYFSRNDAVHLEITDVNHDAYYGVTLHRHRPSKYPEKEAGWISRRQVSKVGMKKIDPAGTSIDMASWHPDAADRPKTSLQKKIDDLVEHFEGKGVCSYSIVLAIEGGWVLTGRAEADLKEKDKFQLQERYVVDSGDKKLYYKVSRDIVCDEGRPERMNRLVLEEASAGSKQPADVVRLKDLQAINSPWIVTFQGPVYKKMLVVNNWETYDKVRESLEDMLATGDGFLSGLKAKERQITLNFLIQQISIFRHKEDFEQ